MASSIHNPRILQLLPRTSFRNGLKKYACAKMRFEMDRLPVSVYGGNHIEFPARNVSIEKSIVQREWNNRGLTFTNTLYKVQYCDEEGNPTGEEELVLPRDLGMSYVSDDPVSVNFLRYWPEKGAVVNLPFVFSNESLAPGVRIGGRLNVVRPSAYVHITGDVIPPYIEVNVANMRPGQRIRWSDLDVPKNIKLVKSKLPKNDRNITICNIRTKGLSHKMHLLDNME